MSLVRFRLWAPFAGLAHLVERHLAKVEVASSSLVARSKKKHHPLGWCFFLEHFRFALQIARLRRLLEKSGGKPAKVSPANTPVLAKNEGFCIRQTKRTCCRHPCVKRISIRGEAGFLRRAHKLHTPCMDINVPTRMDGAFCFDCKRRKHTQTGGTERFSMEFAAAPPCL